MGNLLPFNEKFRPAVASSGSDPRAYTKIEFDSEVDRVIVIDQSPIGKTPRSNPATYTKVFDEIRQAFAGTKEAKVRGYKPGRFSFNLKGGRCEACEGDGLIKIEMNFLPDVYVECEECRGKRYNRETLDVKYKGRSIAEVLDMTVEEALTLFTNIPSIRHKLETLSAVGLDYIKLGQSSTTLSGGEAQRIKLTPELSDRWIDEQMEGARRSYRRTRLAFHPLSDREMEVLSCVVRGMSNKEIANLLGISHQTVKNHVTSILRKFGVE